MNAAAKAKVISKTGSKTDSAFSLSTIAITLMTGWVIFQDSVTQLAHKAAIFNYLDEALVAIALAAMILHYKDSFSRRILPVFLLMVVFWLTGIVAGLTISADKIHMFPFLMESFLMVKCFILIASLCIVVPRPAMVMRVRKAVLFWAWVSVPAGLVNAFAYPLWHALVPYTFDDVRMGISSAMGLFIHPGQYGWFMMFVGLMYLAEFVQLQRRKSLYYAIVMMVCAVLSMKVKVIVTLAVVVLFCVFFTVSRKTSVNKLMAAFVVLGGGAVAFGPLVSSTFSKYFTDAEGNSARYALLSTSERIISDYFPMGVGFSQFGSWYARIDYSQYYYQYKLTGVYGLSPSNPMFATDTFWPSIFGETGALGTLCYFGVLIGLFFLLFRNYRATVARGAQVEQREYAQVLSLFAIFVLLQAVVESTGEAIFNGSPQNLFIGSVIGLALAYGPLTRQRKAAELLDAEGMKY